MRILLANTSAHPVIGGVENSLRYIGRELLRAGHEVKIFCLQTAPGMPPREEHEGVEILRAPYTARRWPHARLRETAAAAQQAIGPVLREFAPDAIWSRAAAVGVGIRRGGYSGPLLQIFATNARMHCRGVYLQTHGMAWKRRLMMLGLWPLEYVPAARMQRELARHCTAVAFSENMRGQLLADFPADARRCQVIPPGVDAETFAPARGQAHFEAIAHEYGLRPGAPLVLYVGRIAYHKHIPLLMDAVRLLQTPARLVLVGNGPDEARLAAYAARIGLDGRVIFAGPQRERLPGYYALSRVSALPTTTESFGQVYLESLACGTPAVGFAGDGRRVLTATQEIIRDGETGGVAGTVSAAALAEKLDAILALDEAAYAAMAQRARDDVQARYSWAHFVAKALELSA